jgi:hypothetical protein
MTALQKVRHLVQEKDDDPVRSGRVNNNIPL